MPASSRQPAPRREDTALDESWWSPPFPVPGSRFPLPCSRFPVPASLFSDSLFPIPDAAADVDRPEALLTPADDEDAETLLHARLDVVRRRRIAARHVELLARREHLLNRRLPPFLVDDALSLASVVVNTPRSVPAPGNNTPMPCTAAISRTRARPALLSTMVKFTSSPFGLSGQRSAFSRYSFSLMPQYAGASPTVSERVPPLDLNRIAARPALTSSGLSTPTNTTPLTPRLS